MAERIERTIIKGGLIYDGSGKAPFHGDIVIGNGKIEEIAPFIEGEFAHRVNAEGYAVTPGFVDVHRHCDRAALTDPEFGALELAQGITTVVGGNCGMSLAPSCPETRESMYRFLEPCLGRVPRDMAFSDFGSYRWALDQKSLPLHMEAMVGTGAVRIAVKGFDREPFTDRELERACALLEQSFSQGALAASAGIMYVPECFNLPEDWHAFGRVIARRNKLLTVHIRGEGDGLLPSIREVINLAEKTGVKLNVSHFKSVGVSNWKRDIYTAAELIDRSDADITVDVYPYSGGATMLGTLLPPALTEEYGEGLCAVLGTRAGAKKAKEALKKKWKGWDDMLQAIGSGRILISSLQEKDLLWMIGKTLADIVDEGGFESEAEAIAYLMAREEGRVGIIVLSMCPEDVEFVASLPCASFISDALYDGSDHPHPRLYGAFPKVIEDLVLKKKLLSLEEAVHKMSGKPAERFGIENRGLVREGYFADLLIFKPEEIRSRATYENPVRRAEGMHVVFAEGKSSIKNIDN